MHRTSERQSQSDDNPVPPIAEFWHRADVKMMPDPSRTVLRPFSLGYPEAYSSEDGSRTRAIIERVLSVDERTLESGLKYMKELLDDRHRNMPAILMRHFEVVEHFVPDGAQLTDQLKLLIGGFFSEEYAFEAAALFNPSVVRHWDQSGLDDGAVRLILSLRGIGEGHISSVTFRTGIWDGLGRVTIDPPSSYAEPPTVKAVSKGDTELHLDFDGIEDISEAVLFPMTPSQSRGIEDLRLVTCSEDDGTQSYVGTFTAFDGTNIRQEILTTKDFRHFDMRPIEGKIAQNKGMALFPRRIDGRYAMIGRQDNENIWLMFSDDLYRWDKAEKIITPRYPWEFAQMGNCGSPIELDEGWLLMTHAVGIVRNYTISACLLDKKDPSKVLARANIPLLRSGPEQRDGYVPNVVYSCGSLVQDRRLLVPYGVADNFTTIVTGDVDALIAHMS
jgi:predicted GH43/DUF377 family glycosyl hydrolase